MSQIEHVQARQILDSRGNPTVEAELRCARARTGAPPCPRARRPGNSRPPSCATAATPGRARASRQAVANVNGEIAEAVKGRDAFDQRGLDEALIALDGTPNKARLGANAILAVSLAAAHAAAAEAGQPLWRYLGGEAAHVLPVPMMNVLNGGAHADNKVDFQEFMVVPERREHVCRGPAHGGRGLPRAQADAERARAEHRRGRRGRLRPRPRLQRGRARGCCRRHPRRGLQPDRDVAIAMDPATSEFYDDGAYVPRARGPHAVRRPS